MAISYDNLWKLLIDRHMTKTQMRLAVGLSTATLAKLSKRETVRTSIIDKICKTLNCRVRDVMEYESDCPTRKPRRKVCS